MSGLHAIRPYMAPTHHGSHFQLIPKLQLACFTVRMGMIMHMHMHTFKLYNVTRRASPFDQLGCWTKHFTSSLCLHNDTAANLAYKHNMGLKAAGRSA